MTYHKGSEAGFQLKFPWHESTFHSGLLSLCAGQDCTRLNSGIWGMELF